MEKIDFFVSRAGADAAWAQWIAWQLESKGYRVVIQDWDFRPGVNFVPKMQQASASAERTIAVLSPRYFQSSFTEAEWTAAFYRDTTGSEGRLLPIRIENFSPPGVLGPRNALDLFDLDVSTARQHLLEWVGSIGKRRLKPDKEPSFPGRAKGCEFREDREPEPNFPGNLPSIFRLPARNPNFTGREALLAELRNQLTGDGKAVVTAATRQVAACGLGGIGKSHLAIEYAWRWASDYTRIIWLRAESPESLGADLDALSDELGLFGNNNKPAEQAKVIASIRRHLEQTFGWLMVFDNAPDPRVIEHAVPRSGGHVLYTSRYNAWGQHASALRVDVWLPQEAEQFLLRRVGGCDEDPKLVEHRAALQLADELGYLPLALEHGAAFCEQSSLAVADYLRLFRERRLELFRPELLAANRDDEIITVTTTWNLSLDRISQNEKCPEAAAFLTLCAFFGPDLIPLSALRGGAGHLQHALSGALSDDLAVERILAALLRYSLVSVAGSGNERGVSVHRLLQEVTRKRLPADEERRWRAAALRIVNQAFPDNSGDARVWNICGQLRAHAVAVLHEGEQRAIAPADAASLFDKLADYARGRAEYASAEPLYRSALAIRQRTLGPDHPDTAVSLNNLAMLYDDEGRYQEAEPLYRRALTIREKTLGADHPDTARTLNNLALLFDNQGRCDEARPLYERAISVMERVLGPNHRDTATILNNLAALCHNQGDYKEAERLYARALAIKDERLGPHHSSTAKSLNNLALLYHDQGRHEDAESLHKRALAIREGVLGPEHPDTANTLNDLARLYENRGRHDEAEHLHRRALAVREKVLGPDHPDTARSLEDLALLCEHQARFQEADLLYRRALSIKEEALGAQHPSTVKTRANYEAFLRKSGRDADLSGPGPGGKAIAAKAGS